MRWEWAQWFEKRWWKRYLEKRPVEVYLEWKRKYWQDFLNRIEIDIRKDAKILDIGCGRAGVFTILNQSQTVACDPLLLYYEEHIAHFSKAFYPNTEFVTIAFENSSWKNEFDVVFCLNVINHVRDFDTVLKRLVDTGKSSAQFVLSIDCHNYQIPKWLFRILPIDILHPHQYDLSEYLSEFESQGLKVERKIHIKSGFFFDYYAVVCTKK